MPQLITCPDPDCGAPAEVTERFTMPSTDGTVVHIKTICARQHWFAFPADRMTPAATDPALTSVDFVAGRSLNNH